MSNAGKIHLDAKIDVLQELLTDIKEHEFTTTHQIVGLIQTNLDILESIKRKEPEMTSEQYAHEANLDALTDGKL